MTCIPHHCVLSPCTWQTCPNGDYRAEQCNMLNVHQPLRANFTWKLYDSESMGSCEGSLMYLTFD